MKFCTGLIAALAIFGVSFLAHGQATNVSEACPYTAAELSAALGIQLNNGQGTESPFPGGKMMSCDYKGQKNLGVVLSQVKAAKPADAMQIAKGSTGTAIAGDTDSGVWVATTGSVYRLTLSYVRGSTHTEFSVTGVDSKNAAEATPMKTKILKLRRVP